MKRQGEVIDRKRQGTDGHRVSGSPVGEYAPPRVEDVRALARVVLGTGGSKSDGGNLSRLI